MHLSKQLFRGIAAVLVCFCAYGVADENLIEKQLEEIGTIPNREVIAVQKKYTRKDWRHELTPVSLGGIPFGTVRRTLTSGLGYTLHWSDSFATEANFIYTKNFLSSFTDDINNNNPSPNIRPQIQNLVLVGSAGIQLTPWYGKMATFSRWIVYVEPFLALGVGIAKTDLRDYFTFYPGIGIRAFFREWVSLRIDFRNYIYQETSSDGTSLRSNFTISASLSFWLPKMPG
ncbi:MAG: outer membrane beta-barrel domain-containing protein [Bdellovibrionales bacterium]|nr:outer membrane beta-barrel domain-containing protein [Bdellovibrionales bacterium]